MLLCWFEVREPQTGLSCLRVIGGDWWEGGTLLEIFGNFKVCTLHSERSQQDVDFTGRLRTKQPGEYVRQMWSNNSTKDKAYIGILISSLFSKLSATEGLNSFCPPVWDATSEALEYHGAVAEECSLCRFYP